jgi:uncharacterized damage-inducible protein DinB
MTEDLRYPTGRFQWPESVSAEDRPPLMGKIAATPADLRAAVSGLSEDQLDTPYREGGWTVRQVVHHVPDSHMNSYVRFKLALTEDEPSIKPYDEAAWAMLGDSKSTPIETSLCLLNCLHIRWVELMRGMTDADWKRKFHHPERGPMRLDQTLALYAWHGDHHAEHINALRRRKAW